MYARQQFSNRSAYQIDTIQFINSNLVCSYTTRPSLKLNRVTVTVFFNYSPCIPIANDLDHALQTCFAL